MIRETEYENDGSVDFNKPVELSYRTRDHPAANGRHPQIGDTEWAFRFPLEDGRTLEILGGPEDMLHIRSIVDKAYRDEILKQLGETP